MYQFLVGRKNIKFAINCKIGVTVDDGIKRNKYD
jgi:hypothetical protein